MNWQVFPFFVVLAGVGCLIKSIAVSGQSDDGHQYNGWTVAGLVAFIAAYALAG